MKVTGFTIIELVIAMLLVVLLFILGFQLQNTVYFQFLKSTKNIDGQLEILMHRNYLKHETFTRSTIPTIADSSIAIIDKSSLSIKSTSTDTTGRSIITTLRGGEYQITTGFPVGTAHKYYGLEN